MNAPEVRERENRGESCYMTYLILGKCISMYVYILLHFNPPTHPTAISKYL